MEILRMNQNSKTEVKVPEIATGNAFDVPAPQVTA